MLKVVEVEEGDIIVDLEKKRACLYSVGILVFGSVSGFWRFYSRFLDTVKDCDAGPLSREHYKMLGDITSSRFVASIEKEGLDSSVLWASIEDIETYTTRPRTRSTTKAKFAKIADAMSKAFKSAPEESKPWRTRYELSVEILKRQIAPLLVQRRLVPEISSCQVVDARESDLFDCPTTEHLLDVYGHIDAVARVGRSGLVGLSVKYSERHRSKLCVGLGLFGNRVDGDAYLEDNNRRLLPQYLVSVNGELEIVSSILVVERWVVADVLTRALRDLRLSGRELADIEVETGLVLSGVYLYRVSPRKVLVSIPWAVLQAYGAECSRTWFRSRAAS